MMCYVDRVVQEGWKMRRWKVGDRVQCKRDCNQNLRGKIESIITYSDGTIEIQVRSEQSGVTFTVEPDLLEELPDVPMEVPKES